LSLDNRSAQHVPTIVAGVLAGDRATLGRAITLMESTREDDRALAVEVLESVMEATGNSVRVGISGPPGVGKSTFIDVLGCHLIDRGNRVAVLAVDPSSAVSGGSILGDKTRMERFARCADAFVRPSPSGRAIGGIAQRTREALLLCEAAGYNVIIVETVGAGQADTLVADMTDVFVLLLQPGGGDELQGIKRGIVESADLIIVNKADGELEAEAERTATDYRAALNILRPRTPNWRVPVEVCSARTGKGVPQAWDQVERYVNLLRASGTLAERRREQARAWLWSETICRLENAFRYDRRVVAELPGLESAVADGAMPPTTAAARLLQIFLEARSGL
jgi:GTPase